MSYFGPVTSFRHWVYQSTVNINVLHVFNMKSPDKQDKTFFSVVHIHNGILAAIKKNEIGSFVEMWV